MGESGPAFVAYFGPVLDALRDLGASARPKEVKEWIVESLDIPDDVLVATNKNGLSKFGNQVDWARFYLAKGGYLDSGGRGIWTLTEKGRKTQLEHPQALAIYRKLHPAIKNKKENGEIVLELPSSVLIHHSQSASPPTRPAPGQ